MFLRVSLFVNCYLPRFSAYTNSETPGLLKAQNKNTKNFNFFLTKASLFAIISLAVADVAHPVERHLAKVEVASSSLVIRSINSLCLWQRLFLFLSKYSTTSKIKKEKAPAKASAFSGATGRTRTGDLLITNQLLYQLSHSSRKINSSYIISETSLFFKSFFQFCWPSEKYFCAARPPLLLPAFFCAIISAHPPVAKLDIAADSDSEGRGFESLRAGQKRNNLCLPDKGCFFSVK